MKPRTCHVLAAAGILFAFGCAISFTSSPATAGEPGIDRVLGIDQPDCCHVINLLMRNRARQFSGYDTPITIEGLGAPHPGDLELLEVSLVCDATAGEGPIFQVSFRNSSRWAVHDFQLSIVGVLERISVHAPCRSMRIPCIAAGETKCVELQLPFRCMSIGLPGQGAAPFDTVVVALDSFDELVECNELNNVAILKRSDIPLRAVVTSEEQDRAEPPSAAAPEATAPADGSSPAPVPDTGSPQPTSPEKIDFDQLGLDEGEQAAMFIRKTR